MIGTEQKAIDLFFKIRYDNNQTYVCEKESEDEEDKNKVLAIIDRHPEVKKIQHFNSTPVGYKYQISFTIYVDGNLTTYQSHEIANNLEKEIDREIDEIYLTVIHVNPI